MDFYEVLKNRHCVRDFDPDKEVSSEQLEKLSVAGKLAPSAGNLQDWRFTIVKDQATKEKLVEACRGKKFVAVAPVVLIISSDIALAEQKYGDRGVGLYAIQDIAACAENIFLAVVNSGLSTCWVGGFEEDKVREILELPATFRPMVIFPIGYAK